MRFPFLTAPPLFRTSSTSSAFWGAEAASCCSLKSWSQKRPLYSADSTWCIWTFRFAFRVAIFFLFAKLVALAGMLHLHLGCYAIICCYYYSLRCDAPLLAFWRQKKVLTHSRLCSCSQRIPLSELNQAVKTDEAYETNTDCYPVMWHMQRCAACCAQHLSKEVSIHRSGMATSPYMVFFLTCLLSKSVNYLKEASIVFSERKKGIKGKVYCKARMLN